MTNETKKAIEVLKEAFDGDWLQPRTIDALNHVIQLVRDTSELLSKVDSADFDGDFCITRFNNEFQAKEYDEDGTILLSTEHRTTVLEAYREFRSLKSKS